MWSLITIILSLILLMILAMRGFTIIIIAPVVSLFVMILNNMPIIDTFQNDYMNGFTNYVKNYFLIFLFAAMFGKFMEESGAARTIAQYLLKISGKKSKLRVLVTIMFVCALLTYGGVSLFVVIFAHSANRQTDFQRNEYPMALIYCGVYAGDGDFYNDDASGNSRHSKYHPDRLFGDNRYCRCLDRNCKRYLCYHHQYLVYPFRVETF